MNKKENRSLSGFGFLRKEGKMEFKASKEYLLFAYIICLLPIMGGIAYLMYAMMIGEDMFWIFFFEIILLTISMEIWSVVVAPILRKIEIDASGCRISWLWWKKIYLWSDLDIISKDLWGNDSRSGRTKYRIGVIFSKKKKNKEGQDIDGMDINFSMKYLTEAFYVVFPSDEKYTFKEHIWESKRMMFEKISLSDPFCVNEEDFMRQLKEWNVSVTETKTYRKWKYTGRI